MSMEKRDETSTLFFQISVCGQDGYYQPPNIKSQRIVNGSEVRAHNYPWMAFLIHPWSGICGGSIITDRTILSAGKL